MHFFGFIENFVVFFSPDTQFYSYCHLIHVVVLPPSGTAHDFKNEKVVIDYFYLLNMYNYFCNKSMSSK